MENGLYIIWRDEDMDIELRWRYGTSMIRGFIGSDELDAWTRYGDDRGGPLSLEQADTFARELLDRIAI